MISDKGIPTSVVSEALDRVAVARWTQAVGEKGRSDNGVRPGNEVTFLIDGVETFAAMYKAICTAKKPGHYIYLLGWYLDGTLDLLKTRGTSVKSLFSEASARGVQIRVMVWDARPMHNFVDLIKWINELPTGAGILDNNTLYFPEAFRKAESPFEWARSNRAGSHHQKVLLVKGQEDLIAFCGGVDINRDRVYETKQPGSPMHDVHCRIKGPAAHDLVDVFVQRWFAHPEHCKLDKPQKDEKDGKGPLLGLSDRIAPKEPNAQKGNQFVRIARTFNFVGKDRQSQCAKEHSISSTMIGAIAAARRFIYIEDQYLVSLTAARALGQALKNIQYLTILIPHTSMTASMTEPMGTWSARKKFMLEVAGNATKENVTKKLRIFYRFTPGPIRFGPHSYIHAKTWIFDDELAVIGSANCNNRGWSHDSEVIAAIFDKAKSDSAPSFAQKLRMDLWAEHLGVERSLVVDGLKSADLWLNLPPKAQVRAYVPVEQDDSVLLSGLYDRPGGRVVVVDPDAEYLKPCGEKGTAAC